MGSHYLGPWRVDVEWRDHVVRLLPAAALARSAAAALDEAGAPHPASIGLILADDAELAGLNAEHMGKDGPTDVLSFPVDGDGPVLGERELGDVVICPEHTEDLAEAVVHGVLHLVGMDHETDEGEMLAVQAELVSWMR
jgi:probable rRNA maturation factor